MTKHPSGSATAALSKPPATDRESIRQAKLRAKAGAEPDLRLSLRERDLSADAIETFVTVLGGREKLVEALSVATDVREVNEIATLLLDPRYDGLDLRRLCALANLTVADLFSAYKKAVIVKAHVEAIDLVAKKLLPVVEDVMQRAAPFEVACYACGGTGLLVDEQKPDDPPGICDQCRGHGKLLQLPDLDRQKLALELGQLVQRSGGVNVLQQNVTVPPAEKSSSAPGALEALQQVVSDLLSRPPTIPEVAPPVDGEVVSAPPTDSPPESR